MQIKLCRHFKQIMAYWLLHEKSIVCSFYWWDAWVITAFGRLCKHVVVRVVSHGNFLHRFGSECYCHLKWSRSYGQTRFTTCCRSKGKTRIKVNLLFGQPSQASTQVWAAFLCGERRNCAQPKWTLANHTWRYSLWGAWVALPLWSPNCLLKNSSLTEATCSWTDLSGWTW